MIYHANGTCSVSPSAWESPGRRRPRGETIPPSPSYLRPWEREAWARLRDEQARDSSLKWLSRFESKPVSAISDADLDGFYEEMRILCKTETEEQQVAKRAVFRFYTTLLDKGRVEEVAQNMTMDIENRDRRIVHAYCFDAVLQLVATRDPETLDLHQPLVQQLLRFSPFSRQGPELPKPAAREVLMRLPEDIIGKVPQRRAALRVWVSDEECRLRAASSCDTYEVYCIMRGIPDRAYPQTLVKAFGGRGQGRYTALLIQNLAPACESLFSFNKLCDQWNHVPAAKDVVLALQATALKEVKRCGLIFFDRSLETVQQTISRIPNEEGRQQVRDVVASTLIKESTSSVQTDSICRTFNHQRTLEDVRECTHGLIARRAQEAKGAVRNLAEGYRHSLGL